MVVRAGIVYYNKAGTRDIGLKLTSGQLQTVVHNDKICTTTAVVLQILSLCRSVWDLEYCSPSHLFADHGPGKDAMVYNILSLKHFLASLKLRSANDTVTLIVWKHTQTNSSSISMLNLSQRSLDPLVHHD